MAIKIEEPEFSSLLHWHGITHLITVHIHLFVAACRNITAVRCILVFYFWTCTSPPLVVSVFFPSVSPIEVAWAGRQVLTTSAEVYLATCFTIFYI